MRKSFFELEILVHGRPIREYLHSGKIWVEGRNGSEFSLRIRNGTPNRVLAVPSVDGLSIMDGKPASFNSGGYIVNARDQIKIPGWRLDLNQVAKFVFNKNGASYAAKVGDPVNVGVVACAFFMEKSTPPNYVYNLNLNTYSAPLLINPWWTTQPQPQPSYDIHWIQNNGDEPQWNSTNCCHVEPTGVLSSTHLSVGDLTDQPASVPVAQNLGVGFGQAAGSRVMAAPFERSSDSPLDTLEVRYDSKDALLARGIDLRVPVAPPEPNPWPGQFCAPPPGYKSR